MLYEHLLTLAKQKGIAGVTVYRGIMGYGPNNNRIDSSRFWELTEKLPIIIEIIDKSIVLECLYKIIEQELLKMPKGCLVTLQPIEIKLQKTRK